MKLTSPLSRLVDPPHATDQKNRAVLAVESCLSPNSSIAERFKSVGTKAEIGFSQDGSNCVIGRDKTRHAGAESLPFPPFRLFRKTQKNLTSGTAWLKIFGNWVDTFRTFGNVRLWEKLTYPQTPKPYASGRRGL